MEVEETWSFKYFQGEKKKQKAKELKKMRSFAGKRLCFAMHRIGNLPWILPSAFSLSTRTPRYEGSQSL